MITLKRRLSAAF